MEKGYMISDASKILEVENHVLRYWEEELELPIPRNELGHRYYREEEIRLLQSIKELKEQGFQLKAIKKLLPDLDRIKGMDSKLVYELREELNKQVMRESLEGGTNAVTPIEHARELYERRQRTWQERSYELEQARSQRPVFSSQGYEVERLAAEQERIAQEKRAASQERLRQFELMMKNMVKESMQEYIRTDFLDEMRRELKMCVEEAGRESESRICEEVTVKLQKELNYLMMQKDELQERQVELLQEILSQVKVEEKRGEHGLQTGDAGTDPQADVNEGTARESEERLEDIAATQEETGGEAEEERTERWGKRRSRKKKKKIFAKSVS